MSCSQSPKRERPWQDRVDDALEPKLRDPNREVRPSARHAMKIDPPGYESGPRRSVGVEPRFHSPTRLIHPGATNLPCAESRTRRVAAPGQPRARCSRNPVTSAGASNVIAFCGSRWLPPFCGSRWLPPLRDSTTKAITAAKSEASSVPWHSARRSNCHRSARCLAACGPPREGRGSPRSADRSDPLGGG